MHQRASLRFSCALIFAIVRKINKNVWSIGETELRIVKANSYISSTSFPASRAKSCSCPANLTRMRAIAGLPFPVFDLEEDGEEDGGGDGEERTADGADESM